MIKSQRGSFSLVGTLLALTVSTGVILITTAVMFKLSKEKAQVNLQAQVDFLHLEGLQILNNQKLLKKLFLDQYPRAYLCFQSKGSGCQALNNQTISPSDPDGKIVLNSSFGVNGPCVSGAGAECSYQRVATLRLECARNEKCDRVEIDLQTNYLGTKDIRSQRTTKILSARALDQRRNIDLRCAAGNRIVTGINYEGLLAKCEGLPAEKLNCATSLPLQGFGPQAPTECQPNPVQMDCGNRGLSATSLHGGNSACTL